MNDSTGGPAFPGVQVAPGMSLRDWFAGQALTGLLAGAPRSNDVGGDRVFGLTQSTVCWEALCTECYEIADQMMAERDAEAGT